MTPFGCLSQQIVQEDVSWALCNHHWPNSISPHRQLEGELAHGTEHWQGNGKAAQQCSCTGLGLTQFQQCCLCSLRAQSLLCPSWHILKHQGCFTCRDCACSSISFIIIKISSVTGFPNYCICLLTLEYSYSNTERICKSSGNQHTCEDIQPCSYSKQWPRSYCKF